MIKTEFFLNDGFGWSCLKCAEEFEIERKKADEKKHSRFFSEGEAESKMPNLFNSAQAKWTDNSRSTLICPNCQTTELIEKA